jgi:hypothetical protein
MKIRLLFTLVVCVILIGGSLAHDAVIIAEASDRPVGADPTPTPSPDPELDQARRDALLAVERQKKAEAEKALLDAQNGKLKSEIQPLGAPSNLTIPTGSVTTDQAGFVEVQMLAQEASRVITEQLANSLCPASVAIATVDANGKPKLVKEVFERTSANVKTIVIYNSTDISSLSLYRSMLDQLRKFKADFESKATATQKVLVETNPMKPPPAGTEFFPPEAIPGAATGIIKSVAELVNLFRTDTQFQNKTVTINEDIVVSYLVDDFGRATTCKDKPALYYPALYPPSLFLDPAESELITTLSDISGLRSAAAVDIKRLDDRIKLINDTAALLKKLEAEKKEKDKKANELKEVLKTDPKCKTEKCQKLQDDIKTLGDQITDDNEKIDQNTGNDRARFKANSEDWLGKLSPLKLLIQALVDSADQITQKLNTLDEPTKLTAMAQLLRAERLAAILKDPTSFVLRVAVNANGTTKIKKNLFVDAKVRHSAAANLSFQLFDVNGSVAMAKVMQCYFDYQSSQDVKLIVANKALKEGMKCEVRKE